MLVISIHQYPDVIYSSAEKLYYKEYIKTNLNEGSEFEYEYS